MATGDNILTYFNGTWHKGNVAIINAADHGAWLGSNVFDGARYFNGAVSYTHLTLPTIYSV